MSRKHGNRAHNARARQGLRTRALAVAITAIVLFVVGVSSAGASSGIEGIWSFNGGRIAVQPATGGTYEGIVIDETKFAECTHPVGQVIWSGMTLQPDGSYWGSHRWYFESAACAENPAPGPTAWRIVESADKSRYLRVCFSTPGSSQPTIAANGASAGVTYGCANSALISPLPSSASGTLTLKRSITLPDARKCFSHRVFKIHLRDPKTDPLKEVRVMIRGHRLTVVRHAGAIVATINLRNLPKGTFTVKIRATTVLGHHLSEHRSYHTCVKKRKLPKHG